MMGNHKKVLERLLEPFDYRAEIMLPSQWAEQNRYLKNGTPFPGPFSFDKAPYLKEILDTAHPSHDARVIAIMKAVQAGVSTGVLENLLGWIISENPCNVLWAAATLDHMKSTMTKKIDPMIVDSGLSHLIGSYDKGKSMNRKTGDTMKSKEYSGGSLYTAGLQNPKNTFRQTSAEVIIADDFEAAKNIIKEAGNITSLVESRSAAFYETMKMFLISTPERKENSNIYPAFMAGDRRYYNIECPCCGELIDLKWRIKIDNQNYAGITYKTDENNRLIEGSVGYVCPHCSNFFTEGQKIEPVKSGIWVPTVEPSEPGYYSYHLNALYFIGMTPWEAHVRTWLKIHPNDKPVNLGQLQTFIINRLGHPFEEKKPILKINKLTNKGRDYKIGIIPSKLSQDDGNGRIVMVTVGADLNGTIDDGRVDYEIVAWSENGTSYSVEHGSIGTFQNARKGVSRDPSLFKLSYRLGVENSIWPHVTEATQRVIETDVGGSAVPYVIAIDTGFATRFAENYVDSQPPHVVGVKGAQTGTFKKINKNEKLFKLNSQRPQDYIVDVNAIKDIVSEQINLSWDGGQQQPGHMNYPKPSGILYTVKHFFSHYQAEEKIAEEKNGNIIGYRWEKRHNTVDNHFWDCRVYNQVIREIYAYNYCEQARIKPYNFQTFVAIT